MGVAQPHPQAKQQIVEGRVLVDAHQPIEHLAHRLPPHPDAERLVDPQAVVAEAVEAEGGAEGGDGREDDA